MPPSVASSLEEVGDIAGLANAIPPERFLKEEARRYQSLADHIRLKILFALSQMDLCPCVLKVITGISDSKLSYHLGILSANGLIEARRSKNWRIYSITTDGLEELSRQGPRHSP